MSRYFNALDGGWKTVNTNIALVNSENLLVDVSNGSVVVQMNPTPVLGEQIKISHFAGDISSNPIIIDPLDLNIDGIVGPKLVQQANFNIGLVYNGSGWSAEIPEDTLASVTRNGAITKDAIKIQNITPSTSSNTGALIVTGGVGVGGDVSIAGNLQVHGSTLTSTSTVVNVENPVFILGGTSSNTIDDNKDRGIQFKWHDGISSKDGFFGFDDSTYKFTFIPDANVANDVFVGNIGEIAANLSWANVIQKPNTLLGYGITTKYAELNVDNIYTANQNGNGHELSNWSFKNTTNVCFDKGTIGAGTIQFDYAQSQRQRVQVYNAVQIQVINWPVTGQFGEIMIELVNGAAATITWPIINWVSPDGSITNNFSYSGVSLQLNGIDWVVLWTRNAGATVYGKVIR